jgi:hypothetical protein
MCYSGARESRFTSYAELSPRARLYLALDGQAQLLGGYGMENKLDMISLIGSIASVLGLFIGAYVLLDVRRLKKAFLLNARIDELTSDLTSRSDFLNEIMKLGSSSFPMTEVHSQIVKHDSTLKNLQAVTSGSTKRLIKRLRRQINRQRSRGAILSYDDARRFYNDTAILIGDLSNLQKNRRLTAT